MKPLQSNFPDAAITVDLDTSFIGVNEREDAGALQTEAGSWVCAAVNVRFRTRHPETRAGYLRITALNYPQSAQPGAIMAAGTFTDAEGLEWVAQVMFADEDSLDPRMEPVAFVRVGSAPRAPFRDHYDGVRSARVSIMQAGPEMILWRDGQEPLHWAGGWDDTWQDASTASVPEYPEYLRPLPAAAFGVYAGDRVVFPYGTGIGWTGILEPRRWDEALNFIPLGGQGEVTGMALWGQRTLIVFKATSVWALNNWYGDLSAVTVERVTDQAGCIAHQTITAVGGDLLWLGRGGVYRLQQVLDNVRQLSPLPVSWRIPDSMDRINWTAADGQACAALADGLWHLAVPVDGSLVNNALFVYDTTTDQWQGEDVIDSGPQIVALVRTVVHGRECVLLHAPHETYAGGQGWHDGVLPNPDDIRTTIIFRGYALEDAALKTLQRLEVQTEELGTAVSLTAQTDGIRTVQTVQTLQTRDRSRYITFGRGTRDVANPSNDAAEANREDYAWVVGDAVKLGSNGIPLGYMQRHKLGGMVRGAQYWVKPVIAATEGRLRVLAVRASGTKRRDHARRQ